MLESGDAGLSGVGESLDRQPGNAELVLRQLAPNGELGPVLRRTRWADGDFDHNGLLRVPVRGDLGLVGKHDAFALSCDNCSPDEMPRVYGTKDPPERRTLAVDGVLGPDGAALFAPVNHHVRDGRALDATVQ